MSRYFSERVGFILKEKMKTIRQSWNRVHGMGIVLFLLLLLPALSRAQEPPPPQAGTLRVDVQVVNVYLTVKEKKGALVSTLKAEDFEVFEDGQRQELRSFERETDRPLTMAVLIDTSGSQSQTLPLEKEAVHLFFRQVMRPSDLALLVSFDTDVDLLQDFTSEVERLREGVNRARINAAVGLGPTPRGNIAGTRLYDAVYLAAREKLGQEVGRKAIIVVSDGMDFGSSTKERAAIDAAQRGDVIIYAVGITSRGSSSNPGTLRKMARDTGGFAVFPDNDRELRQAFDEIAEQLRSQYVLSYSPTNRTRDGKFRKIKIKVKQKGMKVQARRGYYAPQPRESSRNP